MTVKATRLDPVPASARTLSTLPGIDYADAFRIPAEGAETRTGEAWARVVLEDAPPGVRRALRSGWAALGLNLGSADDEELVLGWRLERSAAAHALLTAASRLGLSGQILFKRERRALLVATFLQLGNPVARTAWAGIAPSHRQIVPRLLEQAVARVEAAAA